MPDLNRANRQCCDLDIRDFKTGAPVLFADFGNVTTAGFSSDNVYAMKKGAKAIAFNNPLEGTISIECSVHPLSIYALFGDGTIEKTGIIKKREVVKATGSAGKLTLTGTPKDGTVFVCKKGEWGKEVIEGNFSGTDFTATTTSEIVNGEYYEVGYLEEKSSGINKITINNNKLPKDLTISMETLDKDVEGNLVPFIINVYKATIQRNLELSFSSEGDPATLSVTFDCLQDDNGNVMDFIEITE